MILSITLFQNIKWQTHKRVISDAEVVFYLGQTTFSRWRLLEAASGERCWWPQCPSERVPGARSSLLASNKVRITFSCISICQSQNHWLSRIFKVFSDFWCFDVQKISRPRFSLWDDGRIGLTALENGNIIYNFSTS